MIEGGAVELCFACGGTAERGFALWRKEKPKEGEGCVWGNGSLSGFRKVFCIYVFIFSFRKVFF